MSPRVAVGAVGAVFGFMLCWTGMASPEVIRRALLFESGYLYLMFASAVLVAAIGLRVLRRANTSAVLTGEPLAWTPEHPRRHHIVGSLIFGAGWGVADACPGPVATQLGQGIAWSLFTLAGIAVGISVFLRREPDAPAALRARAPAETAGSAA